METSVLASYTSLLVRLVGPTLSSSAPLCLLGAKDSHYFESHGGGACVAGTMRRGADGRLTGQVALVEPPALQTTVLSCRVTKEQRHAE
jgi:hypothetical protein